MDQREGYKKTKIGWIPEDWDFCKISDLTLEHKQGYYTKDEYSGHGRYLIRITDLKNPVVDFTEMPQLPIDEKTYKQFKVEPGDFLFARSGAIGRYGILDDQYPEAVFASYIIRFRFDGQKVLNKYVGSFYESKFCLRQILSITQGSSNININANNIKSLNLPLPPLPEQKKIASILTTVDDKISSIENQIQQTEQLKKGLMEKLLTEGIGHTEFKDTKIGRMPEGWDVEILQSLIDKNIILKHIDGNHGSLYPRSNEFIEQGMPYIGANNILTGKINLKKAKYLSEERASTFKKGVAYNGDVLFASNATVGPVAMLKLPFSYTILSTTLTLYRCDTEQLNNYYLLFYLSSSLFVKQYLPLIKQTTRNQLPITAQRKLKIILPPPEEQKQIASILSTVDNKIEVLTQKKSEYQTLKKGLSQQLLTGQMRVKV